MTEFNLAAFNDAISTLKNSPEAQSIAEQAFDQAHRFCNEHLHVADRYFASTATKSDILATLMNDMSSEILTLDKTKIC